MDSRIAILGANGVGKSTLLHLIMDTFQPTEGTISKHAALKLAKYSQHSADQLPYDKSPIEHFQTLFSVKFPDKDVQVGFIRVLNSSPSDRN
jgi:ATP-binding cassette subfamily F protein 2